MLRRYEVIWEKIKEADHDQWVAVKFSSPSQLQTIINMVQVEKSKAHVARKQLDLPGFGKLKIRREPDKMQVLFTLANSGDLL